MKERKKERKKEGNYLGVVHPYEYILFRNKGGKTGDYEGVSYLVESIRKVAYIRKLGRIFPIIRSFSLIVFRSNK